MNSTINYSWHVLYRAKEPLFRCLSNSPLFRLMESEAYPKRISATSQTLYHPIELQFTNLFHLKLRRSLEMRLGRKVLEKNFPYNLAIASLAPTCRISVFLQLFMPDMLSAKVVCHNDLPMVENTVFTLRQFHHHPDLVFLCDETIKIVASQLCQSVLFGRLQNRPLMRVNIRSGQNELLEDRKAFFAALLINDEHYENSDPAIVAKILSDNAAHNRKNKDSKLILVNKQAYLAVTNDNSRPIPIVKQEIEKRERMYELGYVLRSFYETYPVARQWFRREMDYLFFATQRYITDATLTFSASFGNTLAWNLVLKSLKLKDAFKSATRFNVDAESKLSNLFDKIPHPHYASSAFWNDVRAILGEDYMTDPTGSKNVNIGTMHGSLTMGDNSPASTMNISPPDRAELLKVIEQLFQLRQEVAEGVKRDEFDELVVGLRAEIKAEKPDTNRVSKALGMLKMLAEGVASHAIAIGLIHQVSKAFGL
jgi:hypothetical protein